MLDKKYFDERVNPPYSSFHLTNLAFLFNSHKYFHYVLELTVLRRGVFGLPSVSIISRENNRWGR